MKKRLELKKRGLNPDDPKEKVLNGIYSQMKESESLSKSKKNPLDRICPKCGAKNYLTSSSCLECGEKLAIISDEYKKPPSNTRINEKRNLNQEYREKANKLIETGNIHLKNGNYGEAFKLFDKAIKLDPNSAKAYRLKSTTLLNLNKPQEALKFIEKSINIDSKNPEALLLKDEINTRINWPKIKRSEELTDKKKRIDELLSKPINKAIKGHLKQRMKKMAKDGQSMDEIETYYRETVAKTQFIEERRDEYVTEAKLADQVYKAYITDGISRLDKINGRFLASQSIKTDIIIEQNNRVIELLETLVNNLSNNRASMKICPKCGIKINDESQYCQDCGTELS